MTKRKVLEYGGMAAGIVLIAFGIGALYLSLDARSTVKDELAREMIVGSPDMSPEGIQPGIEEAGLDVEAPSCDVAEEPIDTGSEARCFSEYMRIHALESSGGLTYAEMGRFLAADDPENPAGTNDEEAALTDEEGNTVPNAARNTWVTETSLSTALNLSYMAEQLAIFGIVVGIALILTGIGFLVLAIGGALRHSEAGARRLRSHSRRVPSGRDAELPSPGRLGVFGGMNFSTKGGDVDTDLVRPLVHLQSHRRQGAASLQPRELLGRRVAPRARDRPGEPPRLTGRAGQEGPLILR